MATIFGTIPYSSLSPTIFNVTLSQLMLDINKKLGNNPSFINFNIHSIVDVGFMDNINKQTAYSVTPFTTFPSLFPAGGVIKGNHQMVITLVGEGDLYTYDPVSRQYKENERIALPTLHIYINLDFNIIKQFLRYGGVYKNKLISAMTKGLKITLVDEMKLPLTLMQEVVVELISQLKIENIN